MLEWPKVLMEMFEWRGIARDFKRGGREDRKGGAQGFGLVGRVHSSCVVFLFGPGETEEWRTDGVRQES